MRIFIAINPTTAVRSRVNAATRPLREAGFPIRWVADENVHLTLKFLGEVPEERLDDLYRAVDGAAGGVSTFDMNLKGFGVFPSPRRPSVVWVGVDLDPPLAELQSRTEDALAELGYAREDRRFHPHLTLGRSKKKARPPEFEGLAEAIERLEYGDTFRTASVDVMRSVLMPTGAVYDIIHSAKLNS
jgi:2'-5' RNA ligase